MSDKDLLYLQYNALNWPSQAKTGLNGFINDLIIDEVILPRASASLKFFDIGFGIGSLIRSLVEKGSPRSELVIEGCEPSEKNFSFFKGAGLSLPEGVTVTAHPVPFLRVETQTRFDFITAVYVFPHIARDELDATATQIHAMLKEGGWFIMVVAGEQYLKKQLFSGSAGHALVQQGEIEHGGKKYAEYLYYSDLPGVGRILDYSREDEFYLRFFEDKGFRLARKTDLEDSGFTCSVFVFERV